MIKSVIKLILLVLLFSLNVSQIIDDDKKFKLFIYFIKEYDKNYLSTSELTARFEIFKQNVLQYDMDELDDSAILKSDDEYVKGITEFSDLTDEEFQKTFLKLGNVPVEDDNLEYFDPDTDVPDVSSRDNQEFLAFNSSDSTQNRNLQSTPASWDWRSRRAVTGVKNQGICGSCWAFATTSILESLYFIKYRKYVSLSEQQLIDCNTDNNGCNGGDVKIALKYIMSSGGLQTDATYQYITRKENCRFNPSDTVVRVSKFIRGSKNEEELKKLVYSVGPVTVTMNASLLKDYKSGIYTPNSNQCNPNVSNHVVTIIGYGTSPQGVPYWIIKNSWGPKWGEAGFFRISRGYGVCGINRYAVTAVIS